MTIRTKTEIECPDSLALQERAQKRIPGMTQLLSKRPDLYSYGVWPGYYRAAKGADVWDMDGNRYLDMSMSGIGANILGYADPDVDRAVIQAVQQGVSTTLNCPEEIELADLLCTLHPWAEKVRYARSGGEAMAIAVRIARAHTGKDVVAFCGYHGWHDWYLSANLGTENALGEHLIAGLEPNGVPKSLKGTSYPFRFNHIEGLQKIISEHGSNLAAVIMEPIRNDAAEPGFWDAVTKLTRSVGAVLVIDEISAGFRLCTGGAHLTFGFTPDIAVFSKGIANGYAMSAIIGRGSIMDAAQTTFISSTNWTERIGPTAALATIRKHKDCSVADHLISIGTKIQQGWTELGKQHGLKLDVGGIAPLGHFGFLHEESLSMKALYVQCMLERGILASTSFYPMYAHTEQHVDRYLESTDKAFAEISERITLGQLKSALRGKPSVAGFKRLN